MANNLNIQNSKELKNKELSLWKRGKEDRKKYYEVKLKKSTSIKTFLFGILLTLICIFPLALLLLQFLKAYIYNGNVFLLIILLSLVLIWFCNGLSNYFTIKLTKLYFKEDNKLKSVDEVAVMYYETLNPGFMIFSFVVVFIFFIM